MDVSVATFRLDKKRCSRSGLQYQSSSLRKEEEKQQEQEEEENEEQEQEEQEEQAAATTFSAFSLYFSRKKGETLLLATGLPHCGRRHYGGGALTALSSRPTLRGPGSDL